MLTAVSEEHQQHARCGYGPFPPSEQKRKEELPQKAGRDRAQMKGAFVSQSRGKWVGQAGQKEMGST